MIKVFLPLVAALILNAVCSAPNAKHVQFIRDKVTQAGFAFEAHSLFTDDGYYLQIFRIYSPKGRTDSLQPVLMWHGLF